MENSNSLPIDFVDPNIDVERFAPTPKKIAWYRRLENVDLVVSPSFISVISQASSNIQLNSANRPAGRLAYRPEVWFPPTKFRPCSLGAY
jgi:hypothetical protein